MKCLEKDRRRRYETASGLVLDLRRHLSNEPVAAAPSTCRLTSEFLRRHKFGVATAAALPVLLLAGLWVNTWWAGRASRAETPAQRNAQQRATPIAWPHPRNPTSPESNPPALSQRTEVTMVRETTTNVATAAHPDAVPATPVTNVVVVPLPVAYGAQTSPSAPTIPSAGAQFFEIW